MHEETGGPKNSHTTDADQNNRQAESKEYGEEIELQDETIRRDSDDVRSANSL